MSVIKNNEKSIEYYDKIYISYHKKPLIKLNIRQIINIIRKIRKKVKKFVDMSMWEVYDNTTTQKKTTLIGTSKGMMKAQRGSGWCKELFDHLWTHPWVEHWIK